MPLYEYQCAACGHVFEHLAKNTADKPRKCPRCGAGKLAKQLSTFAARGAEKSTDFGASCPTGTCPTGTCSLE